MIACAERPSNMILLAYILIPHSQPYKNLPNYVFLQVNWFKNRDELSRVCDDSKILKWGNRKGMIGGYDCNSDFAVTGR